MIIILLISWLFGRPTLSRLSIAYFYIYHITECQVSSENSLLWYKEDAKQYIK